VGDPSPVIRRTHPFGVLLMAGALAVACGGCGGTSSSSHAAGTSAAVDTASGNGPVKVDLEAIFPPGPGRDLVLENCQNCHTFVPIVVLQMDKDAWHRNSLDHRERVTTLTDEQFKTTYEYLSTNFGPHRPVPRLPKELLKTWTGY
jgi:mono/diheme cytochrome c family protein